MGVQIFWAKGPHSMAPAAPTIKKKKKLKPLRRDFRNSDSCKRLSIYLLNRCFSLIILLSYPFLNLPCLTLNYIWDRNSSCYEEWFIETWSCQAMIYFVVMPARFRLNRAEYNQAITITFVAVRSSYRVGRRMLLLFLFLTFTVIFTAISTSGRRWKKLRQTSLTHILIIITNVRIYL